MEKVGEVGFMKIPAWLLSGLGLVAVAIALLAAPTKFEGPILVPISLGHALSVLDTIALMPLLIGWAMLFGGLWQRRERLREFVRLSPGKIFKARMFRRFKWLNRRFGAIIASVSAFIDVVLFQKTISLLFFSRIVTPSSWNVPVNEATSLILRSVACMHVTNAFDPYLRPDLPT